MNTRRLPTTTALLALAVTVSWALIPPVTAQEGGQQVVIGSIALPSRGVNSVLIEKCDPRTRISSLDRSRGDLSVENGITFYWFKVDPGTYGEGFVLEPTSNREVDLDVIFISPATGYSTQRAGGERGVVPPASTWGIVCLSSGAATTFRYTAGSGVEGFDAREESGWTSHTSNLRLLGRAFGPDSPHRMAFQGNLAISGSGSGVGLYRLRQQRPYIEYLSFLRCSGGQGDISIWGDYVFQSVPHEWPYPPVPPEWNSAESDRCNNTDRSVNKAGLRVLDISNRAEPRQVKFYELPCGAMNHTLLPYQGELYIYVPVPCDEDSPEVAGTVRPLNHQIQILRFDPERPGRIRPVGTPQIDELGGQLGCHDLTVFPAKDLAACPQFFNDAFHTSLLDISDPFNPKVIKHLDLPERSVWMSFAAFTWDGRYLVLADTNFSNYLHERASDCAADDQGLGALWIYDVGDPAEATLVGSYELPRRSVQLDHSCAPSEISVVPTKDPNRHVAVVGWNSGGLTIVDLSNPASPKELAHWSPPASSEVKGSYFYGGRIYSLEYWTGPGVRVLELDGFDSKSTKDHRVRLNPQTQVLDFKR